MRSITEITTPCNLPVENVTPESSRGLWTNGLQSIKVLIASPLAKERASVERNKMSWNRKHRIIGVSANVQAECKYASTCMLQGKRAEQRLIAGIVHWR